MVATWIEDDSPHLSVNAPGQQARLVRTVNIQVRWTAAESVRDFKDAESVRCGLSHVPSQLALFPPYRDPGELRPRKSGCSEEDDRMMSLVPPGIQESLKQKGQIWNVALGRELQGVSITGGGGPAKVRNLCVCKHFVTGWRGREGMAK